MNNKNTPIDYSPLVILILVAALVTVSGLYVWELARKETLVDVSTVLENALQFGVTLNGQTQSRSDKAQQSAKTYTWKMVTSWPKNFPGLGTAPERFAESVNTMSTGRLTIKVYGARELVPALGVFDAVSRGGVEMGHTAAYYSKGKSAATPFFTTVPFGMTAQEMNAWLYYGGGMDLWRELYEPFNLVPLAAGNTGVQMAGWFNKEINSLADLKGLRMRIPGIGGEVFERAGGEAVTISGGELYTSLQTGVIDATEWVGPYNDLALGLHEVTKYYYYPGWHEPGPTLELIVNRDAYQSLPEDLRKIVEVAARSANQDMLDEYTARNNDALKQLVNEHDVQLRRLPDDVIRKLHEASRQVISELVADDPVAYKIYQSYKAFAANVKNYHHLSEQAYLNARDL